MLAMLSKEINPPGDPDSFHNDKNIPFSLRQHVLACRLTDVWSNWPFPKKYLHMCFNRGIKQVLPPFESHQSALQSIRGVVSFHCAGREDKEKSLDTINVQDHENECECVFNTEPSISQLSVQYSTSNRCFENEEKNDNDFSPQVASSSIIMDKHVSTIPSSSKENNEFSSNLASSSTVVVSADQPSTSTTLTSIRKLTHKGKRHNGKQKKRKMADILDVAEPCTFQDLLRIKRLCSISSNPHELDDARTDSMVNAENI